MLINSIHVGLKTSSLLEAGESKVGMEMIQNIRLL